MQDLIPPHYYRKSSRARYLRLQITCQGLLEIVVPSKMSIKEAKAFFLSNLVWVKRHQHLIKAAENQVSTDWPTQLVLNAIAMKWSLSFEYQQTLSLELKECSRQLTIRGAYNSIKDCYPLVQKWLCWQAEQYLTPWLQQLSAQTGLAFASVAYRGQKTVWGSCSQQAKISLNYKLLFIPARLVRYVIIHELCHTRHMNHASRFWELVGQYEKNYKCLRTELKQANKFIPVWLG